MNMYKKNFNRRKFVTIALTAIASFVVSKVFSKTKSTIDQRTLKEADFYKRHSLSG